MTAEEVVQFQCVANNLDESGPIVTGAAHFHIVEASGPVPIFPNLFKAAMHVEYCIPERRRPL
jgi:hypothetical protein